METPDLSHLPPAGTGITFVPAGAVSGIPLVEHQCPRFRGTWVSAVPSADGDPFAVPFCGCRP